MLTINAVAAKDLIPFPTQTARFKQVVQRCGQPGMHLSLVAPGKDRELQRLERQSRVMTVHQARRGAGADYGMVGLFNEHGAQVFVFPRSLRRFAGKRVVGIDYDLLADAPSVSGELAVPVSRRSQPMSEPRSARKRPLAPEATPEPKPAPAEPPTMRQVMQRLQATSRLLAARKYSLAKAEVGRLTKEIQAGLGSERNTEKGESDDA